MTDEEFHELRRQVREEIEAQKNENSNGIRLRAGSIRLEGTGLYAVIMVMALMVLGMGWMMSVEHKAIVDGLNDVYIASLLTPETKQNLPAPLKEKLKEKVETKAKEKVQKAD